MRPDDDRDSVDCGGWVVAGVVSSESKDCSWDIWCVCVGPELFLGVSTLEQEYLVIDVNLSDG